MKNIFLITILVFTTVTYSQKQTEDNELLKYQALVKTSDSLVEAGNIKESIRVLTDAIKIKHTVEVFERRALSYFADDDFNGAIADFTKVIELSKDDSPEAYFMRGLSKLRLNDPKTDGCADLKKAKELKYNIDWEMFRLVCKDL